MPGALDNVLVIDFGQYVAGPLVGMLLADQGADVIKVDPPGGPVWETPANATWNRGKRSITLDLKDKSDNQVARRLIERADVVVENFRPGVMARLGLDGDAMTAANPRLVYCSLPGFAPDDPRADVPAWEGVVGAATATYRMASAGRPIYTAIPIASSYAAFQAAVSIAMALNARQVDGLGQRIEVPLFDAMFAAVGNRGLRVHNRPPAPIAGAMMSWTRQLRCKDGRWVQFHAGNLNFRSFLEATGAAAWAQESDIQAKVEELFLTRTAQEWEDFAHEVGTECAVCRTSAEWLENGHARESRIIVETSDPRFGRIVQPGINVRLSETPGEIRAPAPLPDADREAALALADRPVTQAAPATTERTLQSALEGVKVIDLCIVLAGPTCGRTLAEFGADVVKIDSPYREAVAFHNDINRAKRSILIDLKTEEGLRVFWRLVEKADVVVQNFRKGVAERLGIGYEQVRERRPDIVYASLNTYGQIGPWAGRPGHEQIAQAASGMQARFGGSGRPTLQPFAINDYGTGFMGAYGVALALLHRQQTGQGQLVDTALAYTATMLQSAFLQSYEGKRWDESSGQDAIGSGPLHRAYEAADGWLFLGGRPDGLARLEEVAGTPGIAALEGAELERALEALFRDRPVDEAVGLAVRAGFGAHRVVADPQELMGDAWVRAHGLSITREHDEFGPITTVGPTPRLSRTPVVPGRPAPKPGSDAVSILSEVGLAEEYERLVEHGTLRVEGVIAR